MEKLNEIIKQAIIDYEITDISEFSFLTNLKNMILNHEKEIKIPKYRKKIDIEKNFKYSYEFLNSISPQYANYLIQRKTDGAFSLTDEHHLSCSDLVDGKKLMTISQTNTIEDSYSITHELIHDMSIDESFSLTRSLFCEVFSLLSEMLQFDYYKCQSMKESSYNGKATLAALLIKAKKIDFEEQLISKYLENGYIDKIMLLDIISFYKDEELLNLLEFIDVIKESNELSFGYEQRYVIGYIFASYMHDRILNNKNNIQEFIDLNNMINEYSVEDFFDYLGIEYLPNSIDIDLTDESYQKLEKSYVKQLKRI